MSSLNPIVLCGIFALIGFSTALVTVMLFVSIGSRTKLYRITLPLSVLMVLFMAAINTGITAGLYGAVENLIFFRNAIAAPATVVDLIPIPSTSIRRSSPSYAPVLRFTQPDGAEIEFQYNVSSYPAAYTVGQAVTVLYHPDVPGRYQIQGSNDGLLWFIFPLVGLALDGAILIGAHRWARHRGLKAAVTEGGDDLATLLENPSQYVGANKD